MRPSASKPAALLAFLAPVLCVSACRWSVPADPGENARLRSRPAQATAGLEPASTAPGEAADPAAATLYYARCSQCHAAFPPGTFPAGEWPGIVERYGPRAGLFGAERQRVVAWLRTHARR